MRLVGWLLRVSIASQDAASQNASAQAPVAFKRFVDPFAHRLVHPIAGATFFAALKLNPLQGETLANQVIEVVAMGEHIPSKLGGVELWAVKVLSDALVDGPIKKGDLSFKIFPVI
jgi:hypothetical protein